MANKSNITKVPEGYPRNEHGFEPMDSDNAIAWLNMTGALARAGSSLCRKNLDWYYGLYFNDRDYDDRRRGE